MKDLFKQNWFKHFLLVSGMLVLWQLGAYAFRQKAMKNGLEILAPLSKNSKILIEGMSTLSSLEKTNLEKLLNLSHKIENKKKSHKIAFLKIYPYHFASSTLLLILSSISAIIIFITAQTGLNNSNPFVRTIFFVLASLTSFYALSPLVYKLESNISINLNKYISYDNLQGEIYNYAVTSPGLTISNDTLTFDKFHTKITKSMADINSINMEFDYKVIGVPDFELSKK